MGHVPPGPVLAARESAHVPRREHRGTGARRPPLTPRSRLGALAEDLAADFLRRRGATVVSRNVVVSAGEVDLVVNLGAVTIAVEVRSRFGAEPLVNFDRAKREQVWRCALALDPPCRRVDLVAVRFDTAGVGIRWIQGVG